MLYGLSSVLESQKMTESMFKSSFIPCVIITQDVHEPFILDYNAKLFVLVFQLSIPKNGFYQSM